MEGRCLSPESTTPKNRAMVVIGVSSLLFLDIAFNVLLLKQSLFQMWVVLPFAIGAFLGVIWLALRITRLAGQAVHETQGTAARSLNMVVASVVFFAICATVYAFAHHFKSSWDLTQEGRQELAPQTVQILESLTKEVEVHGLFVTAADNLASVTQDKTERFLERCQEHTPFLKVSFHDPEQDPLIRKQLNLARLSLEGTVVIKCGALQKVIPLQGVSPRLEERDFVNALINVVRGSAPKVYFLSGHGEIAPSDQDPEQGATILSQLLGAESYAVAPLELSVQEAVIPADCSVLVLNGGTSDLNPRDLAAVQGYMQNGGRLLVLTEIFKGESQLFNWLKAAYGISIGQDLVVSHRDSPAEIVLVPNYGKAPEEIKHRGSFNDNHPITNGLDRTMLLTGVRSVRLDEKLPAGVAGDVLLWSMPDCWAETDLDKLMQTRQAIPEPGEEQGAIPLAVAVTAKTDRPMSGSEQNLDARVVVFGNREFASNGKVQQFPVHVNLIMNAFAWLTEEKELIGLRAAHAEDAAIVLTPLEEQVAAWIASLGMLHLVALAGLIMYLMRRKYQ